LEAEVFLLGHWKDYDELENSLSMSELIATLGAMHEKENRQNKFLAAIQGIDLSEQSKTSDDTGATSLQDIEARVHARLTGNKTESMAIQQGFDGSDGLGYSIVGLD
jgi:hypothetical protein